MSDLKSGDECAREGAAALPSPNALEAG